MSTKKYNGEKKYFFRKKQRTRLCFSIYIIFTVIILIILFLYHKYPEIKFLIAFAFTLPIIENTIKCIKTIYKYLNHHLYFPLSHEEIHKKILNIEEYIQTIHSLFKFKPLPKTMNSIRETAIKEFQCHSINIEFESLFEYLIKELSITMIYIAGLVLLYQESFIIVLFGIFFLSCSIKLILTI